ncbi:MAG: NAD(P)/FAD-dependent oxidoreductase [Kineosporiaceae bacterium]
MPTPTALPTRADVVIIGAGLAGLACALRLCAPGLHVVVLERADRAGGRVGTDLVDGFRCDRGFQLLNPDYPEARRVLDLTTLALQPLPATVVVASDRGPVLLGDPRRTPPALLPAVARAGLTRLGTLREKLAVARWALSCTRRDPADLLSAPDEAWGAGLARLGIDGELRRAVLEPFLAGVIGEDGGATSRRFVELLIRSFVRGRPSVPWQGMQAIPDQLADALPGGVLQLGVGVDAVGRPVGGYRPVRTPAGTIGARAVVVATDPGAAGAFTGLEMPAVRPLTTFWHATDVPAPAFGAVPGALRLDGERRGPVVNTAALSATARAYSPDRRTLVATTILGLPSADPAEATSEPGIRRELARLYRLPTTRWETVTVHAIPHALTAMPPALDVRRAVSLGDGLFVAGDHRDSASIQGALVSGRRAADAVLDSLGLPVPPRPALDALRGTRRPNAALTTLNPWGEN